MKYLKINIFASNQMRTLAVVLFLALTIGTAHAQRGVRIGYIDTEYILENVNEYQNAQNQLEAKVQQWKIEVEQRLAELETQKIIDYQQKRFGPNGDLMIQKKQLIQPIQDQIFAAVQEIATSKKYDFIFDKSADVVMLYSADRYDISEQVLRTINRTAKREQIKSKKERKAAEEEGNIVEVDSDKDERQRLIDERNAKRAETLAKRKAELDAKLKKKSV